jgi:hypothetical protein
MLPQMSSGLTSTMTLGAWMCVLGSSACSFAQREPARCLVTEPHLRLDDLKVLAPGVSFAVSVEDVAATVDLAQSAPDARIEVTNPLRFSASYLQRDLPLRVAQPVSAFGGRVVVGAGAAPHWLGVHGDAVLASLEPMIRVELEEPLAIPCNRLGFGGEQPYASPLPTMARGERRGTGRGFVPLFLEARAVDSVLVRYGGPFVVKVRQPGWVLLEAAWADGTKVTGWTPDANTTARFEDVGGFGEGWSGRAPCGQVDGPRLQRVSVRAGAPIAASPGGPIWAHVVRSVVADTFPNDRADRWLRVAAITGLIADSCSEQEHVWIDAGDTWQNGSAPSGASTRKTSP